MAPVSQNDALGRKTESRAIEPLRGAAAEDAGLYGARYVLQGTHIGRCADCGKAAQKAARRRRRFNLARLLTVSTGGDP